MIETLERRSFQKPQLESVEIKGNSSLVNHIQHFTKSFRQEGLPYNWADLPGTGFMVNKQLDLLNLDGLGKNDSKKRWLDQTNRDIKGFILEYLAGGLVFPINYHIDSKGYLVDKNYGHKRVVDTISSEERDGSVKKVVVEKIEPFLVNSPDGSIAVMDSPSGWSGLHQEDGKEIIYPDSQTYIFQKKGNEIVGFTIRTDFSDREHRKIIKNLTGESLPEDASVIDFIRRGVALIDSTKDQRFKEIKDVVKLMQDTRRDVYQSFLAYKDRSWNEVYKDLGRGNELWHYSETAEEMIREFEDYILDNELSRQRIKEALAVTVLRIARFLRKDGENLDQERIVYPASTQKYLYQPTPQVSYGLVLKEVQERPGCAGGGNSLIKSITPRFGNSNLLEKSSGFCKECQESSGDNHYHCLKCNKKYSDETSKSSEERTKQCGCGFRFGC